MHSTIPLTQLEGSSHGLRGTGGAILNLIGRLCYYWTPLIWSLYVSMPPETRNIHPRAYLGTGDGIDPVFSCRSPEVQSTPSMFKVEFPVRKQARASRPAMREENLALFSDLGQSLAHEITP